MHVICTDNQLPLQQGHENTHTGARPYACDKCDKKFPTKGNLHNHSKTHDATRYSCPLDTCKRSYSNTNNLKVRIAPCYCMTHSTVKFSLTIFLIFVNRHILRRTTQMPLLISSPKSTLQTRLARPRRSFAPHFSRTTEL